MESDVAAGVEETAERLKATKLSVEAVLSELFLRFASKDGGRVKGFAGTWTFYKPHSAEDEDINSTFRCVRTYEVEESDPSLIRFRTFTEREPTNGRARRRSQDGVFESGFQRIFSDTFFSSTMMLSEAEKHEGLPECLFWRCVAIDAQNVIRIAPGLPPQPHQLAKDTAALYPGWTPESIAVGIFAFESFIEDGEDRWSMGALYSVSTLQLLSHFCIQECLTSVKLSEGIHFDKLPFKEPRPRLDKDTSSWLDNGTHKGEMTEVVWDEDGEMLKLPPRPASWTPPQPQSSTHSLYLYKDGVYAYYPKQLPKVEEGSANAFNQGARFELGVTCREKQEFRRLILRYAPSGTVTSLTKELYKPSGSFDFEKRFSTSVRRSLDTRREHSLQGAPSIPLSSRGRAQARAAKLDQAFKFAA